MSKSGDFCEHWISSWVSGKVRSLTHLVDVTPYRHTTIHISVTISFVFSPPTQIYTAKDISNMGCSIIPSFWTESEHSAETPCCLRLPNQSIPCHKMYNCYKYK